MERNESVQSVERAFEIIEVLAVEPDGLGVTEIASKVGLHKSTAYRIIATMVNSGYLEKSETGEYRIGLKLIGTVSCYINSLELQTEARPYLAQMTADLGLTSHLGVIDGDKVVYVEKMDVISSVKLYSQIGLHVPAQCSSLGKCILAKYSAEEIEKTMRNCKFISYTKNTITSMEDLYKELNKVREQGWGMDDEEFELHFTFKNTLVYDTLYLDSLIQVVSEITSTISKFEG